ncbi:tripartite tricarboxylate transporter TctB family protein [Pseudorhizobium pelagicum]|uniref:DUF1468 domain-containing protein n=1 Tax=Pseudorhizobium pelagicum TaxID=1509405 RepID=A0A922NWR5_9HYPH|nr:tripartite tricarboxylate transporter TctB family protein [Pseudorhizobium pelagicum]KEQ02783.1 hypothetical protein GV67_17045 [Pseudorhizobium pelagicum]KEQ02807.1 hypothetical protein GV68_19910 [Pseudorhizobium pelagicum]
MRLIFMIAVLAAGLLYTFYAFNTLNFLSASGRLGPGFFPQILGLGIVSMTLISVITEARRMRATTNYFAAPADAFPGSALLIICMSVLYLIGLRLFGAIPGSIVFLLAMFWMISRGKPILNTVIAVMAPVLIYLLFRQLLSASMPEGLIPLPF